MIFPIYIGNINIPDFFYITHKYKNLSSIRSVGYISDKTTHTHIHTYTRT